MSLQTSAETSRRPPGKPYGADAAARHRLNNALGAISPSAFGLLLPHLRYVERRPGAVLWEAGEKIERIYFPQRGIVTVQLPVDDRYLEGAEVAMVGHESAVGALGSCGEHQPTEGVVQVYATLSWIAAADFEVLVRTSREIANIKERAIDWQLTQARHRAACGLAHYTQSRIARYLLELADRIASPAGEICITQRKIASAIGVTRTVAATLIKSELVAPGIIKTRRERIWVHDRKRLKGAACSCYDALAPTRWPLFAATEA